MRTWDVSETKFESKEIRPDLSRGVENYAWTPQSYFKCENNVLILAVIRHIII